MPKILNAKRLAIAFAVALAAASVWYFAASKTTPPPAVGQRDSVAHDNSLSALHRVSQPAPSSTEAPKLPPTGNNLESIRLEIRDTKNLRDTLNKLRALPDPTGDISFLLARAVSDCYPYHGVGLEMLQDSAQAQPNLIHRYQRLKLVEQRAIRCTSFEVMADSANLMAELDQRAAAASHPGALSRRTYHSLFNEGIDQADAVILPLLERSPDTYVLDTVQEYLLQRNGSTLKPKEGIGSNQGQAAWLMLRCDLGQDCGGDSMEMVRACALRGRCGGGDVYEMVRDNWLTPDEYAKAIAMKEELLAALRDKDWVRLGFVPLPEKAKLKRSR